MQFLGARACRVAVCLSMAVLCAGAASAQPPAGTLPPAPASGLKASVLAWTATAAADWITTYRFSSGYGDLMHEENPIIRGLDRHPVLMVSAGAGIDAATAWTTCRLLHNHPRLARTAFYGGAAFRAYLAIHNVQMMRRADGIRASLLNHD